jgi:hypothetical protein
VALRARFLGPRLRRPRLKPGVYRRTQAFGMTHSPGKTQLYRRYMQRNAKQAAGLGLPNAPRWNCSCNLFEVRGDRLGARDRTFHGWQRQRRVVTGEAVPDFSDPEDILFQTDGAAGSRALAKD